MYLCILFLFQVHNCENRISYTLQLQGNSTLINSVLRFHVSIWFHFLIDLATLKRRMSVSSFEVNAAAAMRDYYVEPRLGLFWR